MFLTYCTYHFLSGAHGPLQLHCENTQVLREAINKDDDNDDDDDEVNPLKFSFQLKINYILCKPFTEKMHEKYSCEFKTYAMCLSLMYKLSFLHFDRYLPTLHYSVMS